jgi:hypothetical protein
VFFFFPFALEPESPVPAHQKPLLTLPAPKTGRQSEAAAGTAFAEAIAQAGYFGADLLHQALISITSSLAALGNQANLFFSQITAALAFDRMARQTTSFAAMGWPAAGPFFPPQIWAAGLWPAPLQLPLWSSPAAIPAWPANLCVHPWSALAEVFTVWANIWTPAMAPRRPASSALAWKPPFTTTLCMPGCTWTFTLG